MNGRWGRQFRTTTMLAALLALTACGGGSIDADTDTTPEEAPTSSPFPVAIEHALGETTIEAEPTRIVSLTDRDTDTLLALGIVPLAVQTGYGFEGGVGPWAADALGDAEPTVWTGYEFNYEAIAAAEPDLIVNATTDDDEEVYARLSEIAPTVGLPSGQIPWGATTESTAMLVAEAVGREADGRALLDGLDEYVARQAEAHPELNGLTAMYLDISPQGIFAYADDHAVNELLWGLGFDAPAAIQDIPSDEQSVQVSPENLGQYDADVLVVFPFGRSLEELEAEMPTLAALEPARDGRVILLEDLAFSAGSVLSIPYGLDDLVPRIADSVEGGAE